MRFEPSFTAAAAERKGFRKGCELPLPLPPGDIML